jgi:ABC-type multidrug transport system fused ATPase/permease subunit
VQVTLQTIAQFRMRCVSLRAAMRLHNGMLASLLAAPLSFFHTTPSGRIINRFTRDTDDVDRNLAFYASIWFQFMLQLVSVAAVVDAISPFVLPCLVPLALLIGLLYLYFQASVREVRRLDSLARSPIYSAVGNALTVRPCKLSLMSCCSRRAALTFSPSAMESMLISMFACHSRNMPSCMCTYSVAVPPQSDVEKIWLQGIATIKAFRREAMHTERMRTLVDGSSVMQLCNQSMNRWLALRLETIGAVVAFAAAALAIEQRGDAAWVGLTLSYALQTTSLSTAAVRPSNCLHALMANACVLFVNVLGLRCCSCMLFDDATCTPRLSARRC